MSVWRGRENAPLPSLVAVGDDVRIIMMSRNLIFLLLFAASACSSSSPGGKGEATGGSAGDGTGGSAGASGGDGGMAGGEDDGSCPEGFDGEDCDECAPGHFGESCAPCACVNGTCDDGRTGTGCSCDGDWTGAACDMCPAGWAGADCDVCAEGHHPSGADCVVDEPTACRADSASADHYVDPVLGFDDPNYGGGAGACAFRSLEYALSRAAGKIFLSGGTYPLTETIALSEGQELECDADDPGVLSGQPLYETSHIIVRMEPNTAVRRCVLRGEGTTPGYCIQASGPAVIEGTQIEDCGGASLRASGTELSIVGNVFASGGTSIFFQSGGSAHISDNVFHGGPTNVTCNAATTVTGTGNSRPAGDVTCSAPCACPDDFGT